MKLSTRKIVGIEVGVALLWLALAFVSESLVREFLQLGVLGVAILIGWWLLGWARPHVREGKLATPVIILAALLFQLIWFVLFGLKLGFVYNIYTWNWDSILKIFLPVVLMIVGVEILRGQVIAKGHESQAVLILTVGLLAALEMIWVWPMYDLSLGQDVFELIVISGFPVLLRGVLMTYVAYQYDYRTNIAYRLIMELPILALPIIPNINSYLTTMFRTGLLVVLMLILVRMHTSEKVEKSKPEEVKTEAELTWRRWLKHGMSGALIVVVLVYVALVSGIFKYHFLAVGSGSMEPNISRGDMILVEKTDAYDAMDEGDVLVYRHDDVVMVHRIREIRQDEEFSFVTKGDANDTIDNWVVGQKDVIGVAKARIIAVGFPTLWLNELFNGGRN